MSSFFRKKRGFRALLLHTSSLCKVFATFAKLVSLYHLHSYTHDGCKPGVNWQPLIQYIGHVDGRFPNWKRPPLLWKMEEESHPNVLPDQFPSLSEHPVKLCSCIQRPSLKIVVVVFLQFLMYKAPLQEHFSSSDQYRTCVHQGVAPIVSPSVCLPLPREIFHSEYFFRCSLEDPRPPRTHPCLRGNREQLRSVNFAIQQGEIASWLPIGTHQLWPKNQLGMTTSWPNL